MVNSDPHTVKAFDEDIEQIRALVAEMGGLAEVAIGEAAKALVAHDEVSASRIIVNDARIHQLAAEVEQQCVRLIALRAPMADDLREILAAFKIGILVERIGACARSVAEQVPKTKNFTYRTPIRILQNISSEAAGMTRTALDAFVKQDAAIAEDICARDGAVGLLHDDIFQEIVEIMSNDQGSITACSCILLAAQKLERIGDHATNVARLVYYCSTGMHKPEQSRFGTGRGTV